MSKKVTIIGSGFSGMATACYLAKAGCDVTVLEKHDRVGGRARQFEQDGFVYDMGPSWYWMPDIFEKFFADFGKKVSDYYELERLSPSYQVFYKDGPLEIPSDINELYAMFEHLEKGSAEKLKLFLKEAQYKYQVGMHDLVYKPGLSLMEFMDARFLAGIFKLDVFQSISSHIRKSFSNTKIIQLLEFPVLFLGALPQNTPALYSLMNYADMVGGTWYPKGGMVKIVEGMHKLAIELGVKFELTADVAKIEVEDKLVTSVLCKNAKSRMDVVVSSADYHFTEQKLLDEEYRNYSSAYWNTRKMAPSSLIFYVGVNKQLPNLLHHNLFFDEDFNAHAQEIYTDPKWPTKPLFYVSCPSKTDKCVAPHGKENLFILIPIAPDLKDDVKTNELYFKMVISRIEKHIGMAFKNDIVFRKDFATSDFIKEYNSFKGNAYGLANTLSQTAILKPKLINKKVKNLFYTGQLTVPGPGVPPSLISGKLAAEQVLKYFSKSNKR
ncbi:MAG: phytoene desaturase family protein [Bacteroidota bacterium]